MNFQYKSLYIPVMLVVLIFTSEILAHAEHDKARFIANSGVDKGKCDNPLRPCKSILYGLSHAAKGDRLLLAAGVYELTNIEQVLAFKSTLVSISGGYNRFDHYNNQNPDLNITKLEGVPDEMVQSLRSRGFKVLSDGKSKFSKAHIAKVSAQYSLSSKSQPGASCVDGRAAGFSCRNIDLVGHVSLDEMSFRPSAANDIWGHVDLNTHTEYAIVGLINGVAVFDLSNPAAPREVGAISGLNSTWRDIKVYQYFDQNLKTWQAYAYVTVDNASDYVSIIDLNQLPNSVSLVTKDRAVTQAHNVYISNVDYSLNIALPNATPTLQLVGAPAKGSYRSSFLSYSLANPKSLSALPTGDNLTNGYTHDGVSMRIEDERKDADCINAGVSCTVFMDFNEKEIILWDTTEPGKEQKLSTLTYNDVAQEAQYIHSGWWTEDKRYLFSHDEFDESQAQINTTVRIFDLTSLTSPTQVGQWTGPTAAIDHNGYVRGNRYYMSNYTRGITILDITEPSTPKAVGYFDTFSASDGASFNGAWGIYPFLPSGLIIASDISGGLFVLRDKSLTVPQGTLSFTQAQVDTLQGEGLTVSVKRTGVEDLAQPVSVGYEIIAGSARAGEDYQASDGILSWQANQMDSQTVTIDIAPAVDDSELKEQFYVRLFNPTNGATLSVPHYLTVNIDGKENIGSVSFELPQASVLESQQNYIVDVYRNGGTHGELSVNYSVTSNSAIVGSDVQAVSGSLIWQDGDNGVKQISVNIIDDSDAELDEQFSLILSASDDSLLGANPALMITIKDDESNTPPSIVLGEDFQVNTNQTSTLSASATDAQGDDLVYLWQQIGGPNVNLVNEDKLNASFVAPSSAAQLSFSFQVTDSRGGISEAVITVSVIASPTALSQGSSGGVMSIMILVVFILSLWRGFRPTTCQ